MDFDQWYIMYSSGGTQWVLAHDTCGWHSNPQPGSRSLTDILRWVLNHSETCERQK